MSDKQYSKPLADDTYRQLADCLYMPTSTEQQPTPAACIKAWQLSITAALRSAMSVVSKWQSLAHVCDSIFALRIDNTGASSQHAVHSQHHVSMTEAYLA